MLTKETLDKILEINQPHCKEFDGLDYSDKKLHLITPPIPAPIEIKTLTGLSNFIKSTVISLPEGSFFHVQNERLVSLVGPLDDYERRENLINAKCINNNMRFNNYYSSEDFIVLIQSQFTDEKETYPIDELLKVVSLIESKHVEKFTDNGVAQSVEIKSGLSSNIKVPVPNPVILKPYRTFREIGQPSSNFVLRMKKSAEGPQLALFEADGSQWKLEAMQSTKKWLEKEIKNIPVVA